MRTSSRNEDNPNPVERGMLLNSSAIDPNTMNHPSTMNDPVTMHIDGGIARVKFNRPQQLKFPTLLAANSEVMTAESG